MPARERFHVGDIVYVKPLGLVGTIQKVVVSQEVSGCRAATGEENLQ